MSRRVVGVTLDNLEHLPKQCRQCVFWELAPHVREEAEQYGDAEFEKEAWISSLLLEWGSCGRMLYADDIPVGYALYGPPNVVPRSTAFPTGPVSADAILLSALRVLPEYRDSGAGRMLVQAVAKDLTKRGVQAIEAFGDAEPAADASCVVPADFLVSVGFKTVRAHHKWPRLRLELRTALSWKEDVEAALEQLLSSVTVTQAAPVLGQPERSPR